MKKIFLGILIAGLLTSLIGNGLTFNRTIELGKENVLLEKEIEAAKTESATNLQSVKNKFQTELDEIQKILDSIANNLVTLEKDLGNLDANIETNLNDLNEKSADLTEKLAKLENETFDAVKIYEKTKKAMVKVISGSSYGSGFLFGEKNLIVTAYHVIKAGPGTEVTILPNDGYHAWMIGKVIKVKPEWNLAIIELPYPLNTEPLMPAGNISRGEKVVVVGNPIELNNSVSAGVISGLYRELTELPLVRLLQFDASISFGSSGGAVLNKNGEVIGVVVKMITDFSFGFAVPIDYVSRLLLEK